MVVTFLFIRTSIYRLHDLNYSGYVLFMLLIPLLQVALLIALLGVRGTVGPNNYGVDPLASNFVTTNDNVVQPSQPIKSLTKDEQLKQLLKTKHPYKDMLIRNKV